MRKYAAFFFVLLLALLCYSQVRLVGKRIIPITSAVSWTEDDYVYVWSVTNGQVVTLPTPSGAGISYNYDIDWGDGTSESGITTNFQTHTYSIGGLYTNVISGVCEKWYFNNGGSKLSFNRLLQFGNTGFEQLYNGFYGCVNLVGTIPDMSGLTNVTSLYLIFYNCPGLTGSIPDITGLTQLTTIGYSFYGCSGLTGSIPDISGLMNLTSILSTFNGCSGLTGSIPNISGLTNLTTISYAFSSCTGLTGHYPKLENLWKVTSMTYAFYNVRVPGNTSEVAWIFGPGNFTNLTTVNSMFFMSAVANANLRGLASDFTNKTFAPSFVIGTDSGSSSYRMFYNQTNLTDFDGIDANWK